MHCSSCNCHAPVSLYVCKYITVDGWSAACTDTTYSGIPDVRCVGRASGTPAQELRSVRRCTVPRRWSISAVLSIDIKESNISGLDTHKSLRHRATRLAICLVSSLSTISAAQKEPSLSSMVHILQSLKNSLAYDLETHRFKDKANTDIILIPQPTEDLNDPLNWPVWKKNVAFYSIIVFAALTNWVIGGLGVGVVQVTIEFNKDLSSVVQDTISWCILTLGCGVLPLPLSPVL